jgi:hypothetical protein
MSELITEKFRVMSGFFNPSEYESGDPSLLEIFGLDPEHMDPDSVMNALVDLTMTYDPNSPLEVKVTLPSGRLVHLSRSLLFTGRVIESGEGDIMVRPGPDSMGLTVAFAAVAGTMAEVSLLVRPQLDAFLYATQRVVPLGSESLSFDFDSALSNLLGEEENE